MIGAISAQDVKHCENSDHISAGLANYSRFTVRFRAQVFVIGDRPQEDTRAADLLSPMSIRRPRVVEPPLIAK